MFIPAPRVGVSTSSELASSEARYPSLFAEIRADFEDLTQHGVITRARALAVEVKGQHVNSTEYPMYFTGDLDARFVLVHLNPKDDDSHEPRRTAPLLLKSFEEYFDTFRHWGERCYAPGCARPTKTAFDKKQVRFLRPFGTIEFENTDLGEAGFVNLRRVVDCKLQLELIPYGSADFNAGAFQMASIRPHFERILRVIATCDRDFVVFCGKVFTPILKDFVVGAPHRFNLLKKGNVPERLTSTFANVEIPHRGKVIKAGWCQSWARKGLPMTAYAREVVARYAR